MPQAWWAWYHGYNKMEIKTREAQKSHVCMCSGESGCPARTLQVYVVLGPLLWTFSSFTTIVKPRFELIAMSGLVGVEFPLFLILFKILINTFVWDIMDSWSQPCFLCMMWSFRLHQVAVCWQMGSSNDENYHLEVWLDWNACSKLVGIAATCRKVQVPQGLEWGEW